VAHLGAVKRLPLSFLPSLLREVITYDWKFPAERTQIEKELANISSLSPEQIDQWFQPFAQIRLSSALENLDWVNAPALFVEQLSAYLWTTHQLESFRAAALAYATRLQQAAPPEAPSTPRLGMAVVGQGVSENTYQLFRKLRPHGVYFTRVTPENGMPLLLEFLAARCKAHPAPYAHWYVDGGQAFTCDPALTCLSYAALEPLRSAVLQRVQEQLSSPGMGPERLRTILAQMGPEDLLRATGDAVMDHFTISLFAEGSGTQIFSTTFVQWTVREILRRAQPLTLLARFAPRQRQRPMNELLSGTQQAQLDPEGSLIDADIGAYYHWLNQKRLSGAEQSSFLAWFEDHREALVISPSLPRATQSSSPASIREILGWIS
jgi:hypothetical protein